MQSCDTDLLAIISSSVHDMKTPLTSIAGFADAMLDGTLPKDKQTHYLGVIKAEAERLTRICDELLGASRIEAGAEKYDMKPFDICLCAGKVLISLESNIEKKGLSVDFEPQGDSIMAQGDENAIQRVLYNICENAVKFSYEGGRLAISIKDAEEGVKIEIRNEGEGISKEELPFVFDPFFRNGERKGSGLGMYISKRITEAHGGRIYAESEKGKGATFTVILNRG